MKRSIEEAPPILRGWDDALRVSAGEPVSVARHQPIHPIADERRDDSRQEKEAPRSAKVGRNLNRGRGMRVHAFRPAVVRRFDEEHRVETADLRMPGDYRSTECAVECGELQFALSITRKNELHTVSAEPAGAVVQQDRSVSLVHAAYGVLATAGRRIPSPRWKNPGSDTGLTPPIGARPDTACAAAVSSASPTPNVTR